jgi:hypothetical protein
MKTVNKIVLVLAIITCTIFPKITFSQVPACNYQIDNGLLCTITVTVDFYDSGGLCSTVTNTYSPGLSPLNCGACGTLTNVVVTYNGFSADITNISMDVYAGNPPTGCSNSGDAYLHWNLASTSIHE